MNTLTASRPRTAIPAGTSGKKTLSSLTLVQDKARRKELAEKDKAAYLAKGGMQEPKQAPTEVSEEIRLLFTCTDWGSFCSM